MKVLVNGKHEATEGGFLIGSTSTLIKSDKNILVDPGSFANEKKLLDALKGEGLSPEDIDIIILTHTHIDHTTNVHLFNGAKIMLKFAGGEYPGQVQTLNKGFLERGNLIDNPEIARDVRVIFTPGHTLDMMSVVVDTEKGVVVVAGDAIRVPRLTDLEEREIEMITADMDAYEESRRKILELADFIVPGHGEMMEVRTHEKICCDILC